MTYENSVKKCNKVLTLASAGVTIWWRREGFHTEPFRGIEPKWHVLTGRLTHQNDPIMIERDEPVWTGLCGYRKSFAEWVFMEFPALRKTAPKKDTRCRKCVSELPRHLAESQAVRDQAAEAQPQPENEVT